MDVSRISNNGVNSHHSNICDGHYLIHKSEMLRSPPQILILPADLRLYDTVTVAVPAGITRPTGKGIFIKKRRHVNRGRAARPVLLGEFTKTNLSHRS